MPTETFDHLITFGIAGVQVPARKLEALLATRAQLEVLESALDEAEPVGPSLAETREPDLGKINYADTVRGEVLSLWQPLVENPDAIPPTQLLARLDTTWTAAEQKLGDAVQTRAAQLFTDRAQRKAELLAADATRLATEQGLPATVRWLETLKAACTATRQRLGRDLATYAGRTQRHQEALGQRKEDWLTLLSSEAEEVGEVARRFLLLAGSVLLAGVALWLLDIPATSLVGLVTLVVFVLLALRTARPLWRRLRLTRRTTVIAAALVMAYRTASLRNLDEMAKRLEVDYPETLRQHLEQLQTAYEARLARTEARCTELSGRREALQATLFEAPPTIRVLLHEAMLTAWYRQGMAQVPRREWRQQLAGLQAAPAWDAMERDARQAFAFLRAVRAEAEISRLYPQKADRLLFLQNLRDAAIGPTPGEAFLALDFAANAGKPPQVHLLVEVEDPQTSALAQEILQAWGGAGVGVTIDQAADPTALTLIGLVYGYALEAQKGWEDIEAAFATVQAREGQSIYPVLFPPPAATHERPAPDGREPAREETL
ncbi:MAG: hypothetical protein HY320_11425 [Armatimonadetes bacterium]|nr:hypothetical protein [Armatimonadota bacterium]